MFWCSLHKYIYKALFRPFQIATSHNFQTLCIYIYLPERILGPPSSRGNVGSYLLANKGRSEFLEDWFNHVQCSIPTRCINTFSFSLRSTHKVWSTSSNHLQPAAARMNSNHTITFHIKDLSLNVQHAEPPTSKPKGHPVSKSSI